MAIVTLKDVQELQSAGIRESNPAKVWQSVEILEQICSNYPDEWPPLLFLANAYLFLKRYGLAVPLFHRCLSLAGPQKEMLNNLGTCYRNVNIPERARVALEEANRVSPNDPDVLNNLGTLHINEGSPEQAEHWLTQALAVDPAHAQSHWNRGLSLLEQEKWEEGFKEYAWGLVGKDRMKKDYGFARWWDGEKHPDKTLVVYGEQGVGDEIMYSSMLPDLRQYAGTLIFDCHPRLINIFKRTYPWLAIYPTRKIFKEKPAWISEHTIHYKAAIGDIGRYLRKRDEDFPRIAYLKPNPYLLEEYRALLRTLPPPYIGIAWSGGVRKTRKELRSLPLSAFKPFIERGTAISLQYKHNPDEIDAFERDFPGLKVHCFPEIFDSARSEMYFPLIEGKRCLAPDGKELAFREKHEAKNWLAQQGLDQTVDMIHEKAFNYDHTLAFLCAIQELGGCVVSVNTTVVHACGAAGVRCFVLTPSKPAWRYGVGHIGGQKRKGMIWYNERTLTQYRQQGEDWSGALEACLNDVNEYLAK